MCHLLSGGLQLQAFKTIAYTLLSYEIHLISVLEAKIRNGLIAAGCNFVAFRALVDGPEIAQIADTAGWVKHQPLQSWKQLWKVATLSTAFLLSVVLGNVSLRFIAVSFSQVSQCCLSLLPHILSLWIARMMHNFRMQRTVKFVVLSSVAVLESYACINPFRQWERLHRP
jgi:hypothetical protein